MSTALQTQVHITPAMKPSITAAQGRLLQRKCACGGSSGMTGKCEECENERLTPQRFSSDRAVTSALLRSLGEPFNSTLPADISAGNGALSGHSFGRVKVEARRSQVIQTKLNVGRPGDQYEQEADRIAEQITGASVSSGREADQDSKALSLAPQLIQQQAVEGTAVGPEATPAPASTETAATPETAPAGLIVEDETQEVGPGQMRKSEFLDELRTAICAAADAELAAVGRSTEGCPYIEQGFARYRAMSGSQLERGLRRYAPEVAGATTARDYIPAVRERVRRGVAVWATTGQITEVPEELAGQLSGGDALDAVGSFFSGAASAVSSAVGGVGRALGGIFTKAREGGAREADDPQQIQGQLGSGQSLDGGVRSRMESAFGYDFSRVRIHTDGKSAGLSNSLNARAFTIGSDIAFGAGEYQPGTLVGDALLAHELAHVVQQGGVATADQPFAKREADYGALEDDADQSAVGAVVSLWGGAKGALAGLSRNAQTSLRSGLRLQRCKDSGGKSAVERKSVCIRPVQIAKDDGSSPTTLPSFTESQNIWRKCCVDLTINSAATVSKTAFKELDESPTNTPTAEEASLFTAAGSGGSCISVFVPEIFQQAGAVSKDISGGGGTYDGGAADPKVVVVEGIHPTIVAHELGHAMGYSPHSPAGTVMEVTASVHTQKESDKVDKVICDKVRQFVSAGSSGKSDCTQDV